MNYNPKINLDRFEASFKAIDAHTAGEFCRIVYSGFPKPEGNTPIERKHWLGKHYNHYRTALMLEPRGHHDMFGAYICEPIDPQADFAVFFMDTGGWLNMCGHCTIGAVTVAVETGMVEAKEPYTEVVLEAPAGIIRTKAEVKDGKVLGVTLENVPAFLYKPNQKVVIDGKDLCVMPAKELIQQRRSISMIFQQFNLLMQRTCLKNICFPMEIAGVKAADAQKKAKELLEIVGLPDKADAYPAQLSGGQKQRIAIAGVIAMEPKCIVLDEPTAMLDPRGRREVIDTIGRLNREKGITVVLITHHMDEAAKAQRVVVLDKGKVAADGTPKEVFSQVELLHGIGLAAPETVELCWELNQEGFDLPLDKLDPKECAQALYDMVMA